LTSAASAASPFDSGFCGAVWDRQGGYRTGQAGVKIIAHDVASSSGLPFETAFFDVVTMLAVFEHLDADVLIRMMSRVGLVSREELVEHKSF
jgi:methyltransferase family protein